MENVNVVATSKAYLRSFVAGGKIALRSAIDVWKMSSRTLLLGIGVLSAIAGLVYITTLLFSLPLLLLVWIISFIYDSAFLYPKIHNIQSGVFLVLQPALVVVASAILFSNKLDSMFLASLQKHDLVLYQQLKPLPYTAWWTMLLVRLKRLCRFIGLALLLVLLRSLPVVGVFATPVAQILFLKRRIGLVRAVVFGVLSLLPVVSDFATGLLQMHMAASQLCREFLDPMFSRLKLPQHIEWKLIRANEALCLGFASPFLFATWIPIVGTVMYAVGVGAVPALMIACEGLKQLVDDTLSPERSAEYSSAHHL
eukprot:TRINITY_DN14976_c0_g1_i1.p1 TRINITY_DN14976_c0_g1~~TRINITY_DN14976_c0_g1_i1.p1  ORF type:complete len:311 (+),score=57.96 TRINITY_DN14976_c0_g1_i1:57-989(+)